MKANIIVLLMLSGCSILPKPSAMHDFGYPNTDLLADTTVLNQQVPISVEAPKWFSDNRIRYRLLYATPTQVRFYALDRWIAPPPELFRQFLITSNKPWKMPLAIQLDIFEQQFDTADRAKVVMRFTVTTVPADAKVLPRKKEFYLQQPCLTPDGKGAVTGFTILAKKAVEKIQAWVEFVDLN